MADPVELERMQVKGAIRTDFILSSEIMAIALAAMGNLSLVTTAFALVVVALAITAGVYGVVGLIVKLDDIGLHLSRRRGRAARRFGETLVRLVPKLLSALSVVGTAAMLWVGGGILVHGLEELRLAEIVPRTVHNVAHAAGEHAGPLSAVVAWSITALGGALVGLAIGAAIVLVVRRFTEAAGRAHRRLIEVQPAVAAAEEQQGVEAGIEARLDDLPTRMWWSPPSCTAKRSHSNTPSESRGSARHPRRTTKAFPRSGPRRASRSGSTPGAGRSAGH